MGISWHLPIQLDSDSEVNDSILKRLSMYLDATIYFMYISMRDIQKKIYIHLSLLITSFFWDDHQRQSTDELPSLIFYIG